MDTEKVVVSLYFDGPLTHSVDYK